MKLFFRSAAAWLMAASASLSLSSAQVQAQAVAEPIGGHWAPIPIVSAEMRQRGHIGGEGGQWPRAIAVDGTGNFLLFGSDVGGIYRSFNAGATWEPCTVGYAPRGTAGIAIDPHNSKRVLSIGANSVASDFHGVWLSTDSAASWKQVFKANLSGSADNREQIAFDSSTFDVKLGYTRVVYWSRIAEDKASWGTPEIHPALYKSKDGGATWAEIPNSGGVGGSILKVSPVGGVVYAASKQGFFRSQDGGASFQSTLKGDCGGLDVSRVQPKAVWLSRRDGVWRSADRGLTWHKIEIQGGATLVNGDPLQNIHVSPVDARKMVLWREGANWQWPRFASRDGGETWREAIVDNGGLNMLPFNARQGLFQMSPTNSERAWSTGGDWPTISDGGGARWHWAGDGYNVILVGGKWNFNQQNPDLVFIGSQDYNGAATRDGGNSWTYYDVSGKGWGGFCYGAYAGSDKVLYTGDAEGWGSPRRLRISRDGGKSWTNTDHIFAGPDVSFGDPTDPKILFASNFRSIDGGQSWAPMPDCDAVYTASTLGSRPLFGAKWDEKAGQSTLLRSSDRGATWGVLSGIKGKIDDIAFGSERCYIVNEGALKYLEVGANGKAESKSVETLPKDQWGGNRITSVAVDPVDSNIVYATASRDLFSSSAAVLRSTDGGKSWRNLTRQTPLPPDRRDPWNLDGGREAICVRVHPKTREAWVSTSCYGLWKWMPAR